VPFSDGATDADLVEGNQIPAALVHRVIVYNASETHQYKHVESSGGKWGKSFELRAGLKLFGSLNVLAAGRHNGDTMRINNWAAQHPETEFSSPFIRVSPGYRIEVRVQGLWPSSDLASCIEHLRHDGDGVTRDVVPKRSPLGRLLLYDAKTWQEYLGVRLEPRLIATSDQIQVYQDLLTGFGTLPFHGRGAEAMATSLSQIRQLSSALGIIQQKTEPSIEFRIKFESVNPQRPFGLDTSFRNGTFLLTPIGDPDRSRRLRQIGTSQTWLQRSLEERESLFSALQAAADRRRNERLDNLDAELRRSNDFDKTLVGSKTSNGSEVTLSTVVNVNLLSMRKYVRILQTSNGLFYCLKINGARTQSFKSRRELFLSILPLFPRWYQELILTIIYNRKKRNRQSSTMDTKLFAKIAKRIRKQVRQFTDGTEDERAQLRIEARVRHPDDSSDDDTDVEA
jgi:hypothetical protein